MATWVASMCYLGDLGPKLGLVCVGLMVFLDPSRQIPGYNLKLGPVILLVHNHLSDYSTQNKLLRVSLNKI
jgi:hypothetical protein